MKYIVLPIIIISGFFLLAGFEACIGLLPMEDMDIPIVLNDTIEFDDGVATLIGQDFAGLIIALISLVVFSWSIGVYRYLGRKSRRESAVQQEDISGPFILYLRSFADEKATRKVLRRLSDTRTEEEMLIDAMSDIAPVYAIGDPSDKKMPYGATRVYVDDSIWKQTVETLAMEAEVVILRLGQTNNFWWEVDMALKNVPIEKIVFVIPWSKTFQNVSILYKMLLEHGIDISALNVTIDKKRVGSISSVLYFDSLGKPVSNEVRIPRLTGLFLSYDNLLRNALSGFRAKYGFKTQKKLPVLKSRLLTILLMLIMVMSCSGKYFSDYVSLKYQRPYELVEECVKDKAFTDKYGADINGTNLTWAIVGSVRGKLLLPDGDFVQMLLIEDYALGQISQSEREVMLSQPYNGLLLIKKYAPDFYDDYVRILSSAALSWVKYPDEVSEAWMYYKQNIENLPEWVVEFMDAHSGDDDNVFDELWTAEVNRHLDDDDIVDVLKTLFVQTIPEEA